MMHNAAKAMRTAAIITMVMGSAMMVSGAAQGQAPQSAPSMGGENAKPVAGLLVPARTRLIIEYRRTALV